MGLLDDYDRRRERAGRDAENSARLAQSYAVFKTEGQGSTQYEDRVDFGLTFIEKPVVSYCGELDLEDLADAIAVEDTGEGTGPDDIPLPVCTGHVVNWDQDDRDFYVGCWVAARVYYPPEDAVPVDALPVVRHHFTFAAMAMKDIPPNQEDATE